MYGGSASSLEDFSVVEEASTDSDWSCSVPDISTVGSWPVCLDV